MIDEPTVAQLAAMVEPFEAFHKIPRLCRDMVVTEKIDGTNGQLLITEPGLLKVGSRKRWITPDDDNFGFARWAFENRNELVEKLGPGRHFGEWWGQGIQRKYGLDHKRFSLFNVGRWGIGPDLELLPECCSVVPVLYKGPFRIKTIDFILRNLEKHGSVAAKGFMSPEGIVVYHTHARSVFKKTIGDDGHKEQK